MSISRVGFGVASSSTITIPAGHAAGDLLLIAAGRTLSATVPTIPAGWTRLYGDTPGSTGLAIGCKIATSSAEVSGTWTNASGMACIVYRGATTADVLDAPLSANSTLLTWSAAQIDDLGNSWMAGFAFTSATVAPTPPADLTALTTAQTQLAADSAAPYPSFRRSLSTVTLGSSTWITVLLEVRAAAPNSFENHKRAKAGDALSVSL